MINSKISLIILSKPTLVIACSFSFLVGSLILFFYNLYLGGLLLIIALSVLIISIIYSIIYKKWGMLIIYISVHIFFFILYIFIGLLFAFIPSLVPQMILGDEVFYKDKFKIHTSIDIVNNLDIYCKQDTIIGIGPGGGDYKAICIFSINKDQIKYIENKLYNDTIFKRVSSVDFQNIIEDTRDLNCASSIIYRDYGYKSGNESLMYSYVIFSKDKSYMLFCVDYY
jgi:hypothetical protein